MQVLTYYNKILRYFLCPQLRSFLRWGKILNGDGVHTQVTNEASLRAELYAAGILYSQMGVQYV